MNTRWYARPRPYVRRLGALAVGLGGLLALLLGAATPASAHAALIRTDPAQGSVVRTAPQRVVLTFSEGVLLSADSLRVLDPRGANVVMGAPAHVNGKGAGATAAVGLRPGLADGTYTVAWRALSQDSHPVAGAFTFSIGAPSRTSVDLDGQAAAGGGAAGTLYGIARWFAYAGFAGLVGGSVFLTVCWPRGALLRPMRRLTAGGWATLVAATIALLMLRGPYVNGTGLGDAFDPGVTRSMLETRPGAALLSRLLLLAAAAVFLAVLFGSYAKREDPAERADLAWGLGIGGGVVAVGIAATWAMAEHASVGIQRKLAMPVDVVHLLSMAVWLGGLATLVTALWTPATAHLVERAAVRRFSTVALTAVTTLICTGTYQAWRQVGTWSAFTDTSYGRLLLVKLGLVGTLVGVAWFSRRWTRVVGEAGTAVNASSVRGSMRTSVRRASVRASGSAKNPVDVPTDAPVAEASVVEFPVGEAPVSEDAVGEAPVGDRSVDGVTAEAPVTARRPVTAAVTGPGGSERAAQLRRQQAARSAARARKARDADPARGGLRRSVLTEVAVAVVLLSVTTMLTGTQPGRAAEEQKGLASAPSPAATAPSTPAEISVRFPYDTLGPNGKGTAELVLSPGRAATPTVVHLLLTDPAGLSVNVPEVRLAFSLPAENLGPLKVPLHRLTTGRWTATGVQLPLPGTWQSSVTIRTSDIDEVTETKKVEIAP